MAAHTMPPSRRSEEPRTPTSHHAHLATLSRAPTFPTPPDSLRKYSDELRRVMTAGLEAATIAERDAHLPSDIAHDPDYGYDQDPFDTRAQLLLSMTDETPKQTQHRRTQSRSSGRVPRRILELDMDDGDDNCDEGHNAQFGNSPLPSLSALKPPLEALLDSPRPRPDIQLHRTSCSPPHSSRELPLTLSRSSSFGNYAIDTPGSAMSLSSDASFEVSRPSDFLVCAQPRYIPSPLSSLEPSPYSPDSMFDTTTNFVRHSTNVLAELEPCPPLSPSRRVVSAAAASPVAPATPTRRPTLGKRPRPQRYEDAKASNLEAWNDSFAIGRTPSETLLLTVGLSSQRERRRGRRCAGGVI